MAVVSLIVNALVKTTGKDMEASVVVVGEGGGQVGPLGTTAVMMTGEADTEAPSPPSRIIIAEVVPISKGVAVEVATGITTEGAEEAIKAVATMTGTVKEATVITGVVARAMVAVAMEAAVVVVASKGNSTATVPSSSSQTTASNSSRPSSRTMAATTSTPSINRTTSSMVNKRSKHLHRHSINSTQRTTNNKAPTNRVDTLVVMATRIPHIDHFSCVNNSFYYS